jgi:uncharacterized protein
VTIAQGVAFNTLTTVHRRNSESPLEVYRFLREIGSGYIQFIPIAERSAQPNPTGLWLAGPPAPQETGSATPVTEWSVRPEAFGRFLCSIFDEWVQRDVGRVFVQQFDAALANWVGVAPGVCVFSKDCGRALAIEHNGDVFSCDHYVYPEFKLGNVNDTALAALVDSPAQVRFGATKSASLPRACRECPVRFACHGEYPKHRWERTADGEPGLNHLCAGYKRFFTHIAPAMETMAALLRAGFAPATIMQMPRSRWSPSRLGAPPPV